MRILIAGATSALGTATATALLDAGHHVIVVGSDADRLGLVDASERFVCDLADAAAVDALAAEVGELDALVHLVGGWRGGGGLAGQSEEDYRALESSLTALRHVSRALDDDLRASSAGRLAIVSSTAVARPLAGGAAYAAVKAASEAWTRAVAQGWAKAARDAGTELRGAAVVLRVKSLAGLEDRLAEQFVRLWSADAAQLNDSILAVQEKETA